MDYKAVVNWILLKEVSIITFFVIITLWIEPVIEEVELVFRKKLELNDEEKEN